MAVQEHCDPVFQVESSRRALKPLIGDSVGYGASANVGRKWDQVKSMVHTNKLSVGTVAKAFQKPKRIHYTSNSKYFVLEREKSESHEGVCNTSQVKVPISGTENPTSYPACFQIL